MSNVPKSGAVTKVWNEGGATVEPQSGEGEIVTPTEEKWYPQAGTLTEEEVARLFHEVGDGSTDDDEFHKRLEKIYPPTAAEVDTLDGSLLQLDEMEPWYETSSVCARESSRGGPNAGTESKMGAPTPKNRPKEHHKGIGKVPVPMDLLNRVDQLNREAMIVCKNIRETYNRRKREEKKAKKRGPYKCHDCGKPKGDGHSCRFVKIPLEELHKLIHLLFSSDHDALALELEGRVETYAAARSARLGIHQ